MLQSKVMNFDICLYVTLTFHKVIDFRFGDINPLVGHNEGSGQFSSLVIGDTNNGHLPDTRMLQEEGLQLCWGNLHQEGERFLL